jgi:hypothetical protein
MGSTIISRHQYTVRTKMNFRKHEADIKNLLHTGERASNSKDPNKKGKPKPTYARGVYVLSRKADDTTFKIGMAWGGGGLFQRLMSYKLCFPYKDEFILHFLVICEKADDAKALEKKLLKRSNVLKHTAKNEEYQGRWSYEYRVIAKKATLKNALMKTLDSNRDIWDSVMVFNKTGWKVKEQDERLTGLERPSERRETMLGRDGEDKKAKAKPKPKLGFDDFEMRRTLLKSLVQQTTREQRSEKRSKLKVRK